MIIFTRDFPYGNREPYIIHEILQFSEHFTRVYIFSLNKEGKQRVQLPENVVVVRFPINPGIKDKLLGLTFFFKRAFRREVNIQSELLGKKLSFSQNLKILKFLTTASYASKLLRKISRANRIPLHKSIFFNTTFDERSLALVMLAASHRVKGIFSRYQSLPELNHHTKNQLNLFRSLIFKKSDATFFPSLNALVYASGKYGFFDEQKMLVMRPGVPASGSVSIAPLNGKKIKLISISFLDKYKWVDTIIDALEILEGIDVEWHHIGDASHISYLNQRAFNRLFSKGNISFRFQGDAGNEVLKKTLIHENPDVLISLSSTDDIPFTILEALSNGIPVISSDNGGVSEIIEDGKNGFLLSPNPAHKEIADTLARIMSMDSAQWVRIRENAFKTWKDGADASVCYQDQCYQILQMSRNYES